MKDERLSVQVNRFKWAQDEEWYDSSFRWIDYVQSQRVLWDDSNRNESIQMWIDSKICESIQL